MCTSRSGRFSIIETSQDEPLSTHAFCADDASAAASAAAAAATSAYAPASSLLSTAASSSPVLGSPQAAMVSPAASATAAPVGIVGSSSTRRPVQHMLDSLAQLHADVGDLSSENEWLRAESALLVRHVLLLRQKLEAALQGQLAIDVAQDVLRQTDISGMAIVHMHTQATMQAHSTTHQHQHQHQHAPHNLSVALSPTTPHQRSLPSHPHTATHYNHSFCNTPAYHLLSQKHSHPGHHAHPSPGVPSATPSHMAIGQGNGSSSTRALHPSQHQQQTHGDAPTPAHAHTQPQGHGRKGSNPSNITPSPALVTQFFANQEAQQHMQMQQQHMQQLHAQQAHPQSTRHSHSQHAHRHHHPSQQQPAQPQQPQSGAAVSPNSNSGGGNAASSVMGSPPAHPKQQQQRSRDQPRSNQTHTPLTPQQQQQQQLEQAQLQQQQVSPPGASPRVTAVGSDGQPRSTSRPSPRQSGNSGVGGGQQQQQQLQQQTRKPLLDTPQQQSSHVQGGGGGGVGKGASAHPSISPRTHGGGGSATPAVSPMSSPPSSVQAAKGARHNPVAGSPIQSNVIKTGVTNNGPSALSPSQQHTALAPIAVAAKTGSVSPNSKPCSSPPAAASAATSPSQQQQQQSQPQVPDPVDELASKIIANM
jgi:hypothetical protein